MKQFKLTWIAIPLMAAVSCSNKDTQVAEDIFNHDHKIYKIIDNKLREIGDLNGFNIKKLEV